MRTRADPRAVSVCSSCCCLPAARRACGTASAADDVLAGTAAERADEDPRRRPHRGRGDGRRARLRWSSPTTRDYAPQSSVDETTGELVGFDVDVAKRVGAILGLEVSFKNPEWETVPAGLKQGRYRRLHRLDADHARVRRSRRLHAALLLRARPGVRQARAVRRSRASATSPARRSASGSRRPITTSSSRTPTPSSRPTPTDADAFPDLRDGELDFVLTAGRRASRRS